MRFAIRDDDINAFYRPLELQQWYEKIWDVVPITLCITPFMYSKWKSVTKILEAGEDNAAEKVKALLMQKAEYTDIRSNPDLTRFLKEKIIERRFGVALHGIRHLNPSFAFENGKRNYLFGAEFLAKSGLRDPSSQARRVLSELFGLDVTVFTPPQNLVSAHGIEALSFAGFRGVCTDFSNFLSLTGIRALGIRTIANRLWVRRKTGMRGFPHVQRGHTLSLIPHVRLHRSSCLEDILRQMEIAHARDGDFVISTHSYAFNYRMQNGRETMLDVLHKIVEKAANLPNVKFATLSGLLE